MINVAIIGAGGRMGTTLVREVAAAQGLQLSAACEAPDHPALGRDAGQVAGVADLHVRVTSDLAQTVASADALIDFTTPKLSVEVAGLCAEHQTAMVVGTTGLDAQQVAALKNASERVPLVWAPNMSVGVNVLLRLVADATRLLGKDYDLEIVEAHHRHKKDAPSGTAVRLAEVLAAASADDEAGANLAERACFGREGLQPRVPREIGIHAVRGGDVVGDHTVMYCTDGERLELSHRASSRQTFSRGAVRAVRWVHGRPAGLFDMQDVLGLRSG